MPLEHYMTARIVLQLPCYCLGCDEELDLQQPDQDDPDRLLGICSRCHTWYLVDAEGITPITAASVTSRFHDLRIAGEGTL